MSIQTYVLVSMAALIYAPFVNISTAIGEEAGWRGFLYPELNKKFKRPVVWIIGGAIWAAFHFPAMLIGGYEYGLDYIGSPWLGLIVFTVFCITLGVLEEIVYSKTKCIWYAALLHGSVNAAGTYPIVFANANNADLGKLMVLGPAPNGIIAGLPLIILAVIMGTRLWRGRWQMSDRIASDIECGTRAGVYIKPWLLATSGAPLATFSNGRYIGGYASNLPVYVYFDEFFVN